MEHRPHVNLHGAKDTSILSWNYCVFPWSKGHMLSSILSEIDIILLIEILEHEESKVPNVKGFVLWLVLNKRSYHIGIKGIVYYTKRNIFPHIGLHKNDPFNQYT